MFSACWNQHRREDLCSHICRLGLLLSSTTQQSAAAGKIEQISSPILPNQWLLKGKYRTQGIWEVVMDAQSQHASALIHLISSMACSPNVSCQSPPLNTEDDYRHVMIWWHKPSKQLGLACSGLNILFFNMDVSITICSVTLSVWLPM